MILSQNTKNQHNCTKIIYPTMILFPS